MDTISDHTAQIKPGYCHCGCGKRTRISSRNRPELGHVKGQPIFYIRGHATKEDPIPRFLRKVQKTDGCWLWTGALTTTGYGAFHVNRQREAAHRFAYRLWNGPIPDGLFVCHACDNPRCVNPAHLWLGTNEENVRDMQAKGREPHTQGRKGSAHSQAKLTESDAKHILSLRRQGVPLKALAAEFGVSVSTISNIAIGKSWRHVR